jgi:hypothetical protein
MHTGAQQRYYDVLRREERRKPQAGSVAGSSSVSTLLTSSCAASTANKCSGEASQRVAAGGRGSATYATAAASLWDPIEQLHLDPTTVVSMRELVCDHLHLVALHPHFTHFEQLDSLVLSHNALRTLHHLLPLSHLEGSASPAAAPLRRKAAATASIYSGCRRLTRLHVNHNALRDLARDTDIPRLLLLEHLSLAYNQLMDLNAVLRPLRRLRHLRFLDLRGNPLVEEPSYRQRCIAALPQVEVLDGLTVTVEERRDASGADRFMKSRLPDTVNATATATRDDGIEDEPLNVTDKPTQKTKASRARFAKSATAKDLDAKYAAHLRQQQRDKAAAVEARAAVERRREEAWGAFHTAWVLSQPGMPLSEDGWRATMATIGSGGGTVSSALNNSMGDGATTAFVNGNNTVSRTGRKAPPSSSSAGGLAGHPRTPTVARTSQPPPAGALEETGGNAAGPAAVAAAAVVQNSVEVPRDRLLPPITAHSTQAPSMTDTTSHDSPFFRSVRETGEVNVHGSCKMLSNVARPPSPERFAAFQQVLQASTSILRAVHAHDGGVGAERATYYPAFAPPAVGLVSAGNPALTAPHRKSGGGSLSPGSAVAPPPPLPPTIHEGDGGMATVLVDVEALREVQRHKHALIPPPWERKEGDESDEGITRTQTGTSPTPIPRSLGGRQPGTIIQETLVEVLVLLHQLFSAEEIQLLEMEYGRVELLRLLPLPEWSAAWGAATDDTAPPVNTLLAAQQEMLRLLRPGAAASGASGNNGAGGGGGGANNAGRRVASEDRKKGTGAAGKGGGAGVQGRSVSVIASAAGAAASNGNGGGSGGGGGGTLTTGEMAAAALAAARTALPAEPGRVWDLFMHPCFAGAVAPASVNAAPQAPPLSQGGGMEAAGNAATNSTTIVASGGGMTTSAAASASTVAATSSTAASAGGSAASGEEITLQDAGVVEQLVRPIGPYEERVLSLFLKLLKPPPSVDLKELNDSLWGFHAVVQCVTAVAAAAVNAASTAATAISTAEASRSGGGAASRSKKDITMLTGGEADSSEGRKRMMKSSTGTSLYNVAGAASSSAFASSGHEQVGLRRKLSSALKPQLSVLSLLTALLFHRDFLRTRLQYWEQELARMTMAAVAAPPPATVKTAAGPNAKGGNRVGSGGGAAAGARAAAASAAPATTAAPPITPLSRLFHRVQALKSHVARVEEAAARSSVVPVHQHGQSNEVNLGCFVHPSQVLMAYR